jgi:hypothetical protein
VPTLLLWRYWIPEIDKRNYLIFVLTWSVLLVAGTIVRSGFTVNRSALYALLATSFYLSQFILLTAFSVRINKQFTGRAMLALSVVAVVWLVGLVTQTAVPQFLAVGLLAYAAAWLFLPANSFLIKRAAP